MPPPIVQLSESLLDQAADLVTMRFRALRRRVRCLPPRHEDPQAVLGDLRELATHSPGVAAVRDGRLMGFLLGQVLPSFRGARGVYSPEWANAADPDNSSEIYQDMYANLSAEWVADACLVHLVTVFADDRRAIDGWFRQGFGMMAVDAIRDLTVPNGHTTDIDVRGADRRDLGVMTAFSSELQKHLASAPTFLVNESTPTRSYVENLLQDASRPHWIAFHDGAPAGYLGLGPANPSACRVIRDDKTASVVGAFTARDARGTGVGTALLNHALAWAASVCYERCAVDFEPQNRSGARFWLRHFEPICYSLIRHVAPRVSCAQCKGEGK